MDILTMHGPINVKSLDNISKWQMGFKGLNMLFTSDFIETVKYPQHQHLTDKHAECSNAVVIIPSTNIILKLYRSI
jgi:hypothetical protein